MGEPGRTIVLGQTGISVSPYLDPPTDIVLDDSQGAIVQRIKDTKDRHFFVTGNAGCGKTALGRVLAGKDPIVMTADMFLGHKPWKDMDQQEKDQKIIAPKSLKRAPRMVLEEVCPHPHWRWHRFFFSVLLIARRMQIGQWSGANFSLLSVALQKTFHNDLPFGGMQIVMIGDFAQLAPVGHDFVHNHVLWNSIDVEKVELKVQYRQVGDSADYLEFLRQVQSFPRAPRWDNRHSPRCDPTGTRIHGEEGTSTTFCRRSSRLLPRKTGPQEEGLPRCHHDPGSVSRTQLEEDPWPAPRVLPPTGREEGGAHGRAVRRSNCGWGWPHLPVKVGFPVVKRHPVEVDPSLACTNTPCDLQGTPRRTTRCRSFPDAPSR